MSDASPNAGPQPADFWTLDRVADALGDGPRGAVPIRAVSTDTRSVGQGDLFVALAGERFDAHEFLADAVAKGAAAVVVSRTERIGTLGVPTYLVPDTLAALGALGHYRRRAWGKPVVAVAGSNGKTSTKELTRAALGSRLRVHATQGNLNNLVGVPLTLLALPDEADIAVVEMGTNVPGEIPALRAIAEPTLTIITCIAEEHLEGLGDLQGVLREEAASLDGVEVAVTPSSQPEVAAAAAGRARRVVTAGLEGGDLSASRWGVEPDGLGWLDVDGVTVRPPMRGAHNLRNAMLALAAARECGVSLADAARGIAATTAPAMRVAWEQLGRATLINDAYNSAPASARAALELLEQAGRGRQRVAVLGTMREMGAQSRRVHEELARVAIASPIEVLAAVGEIADALRAVAPADPRVVTGDDVDRLWAALAPRLAPDAMILLKASRGVRLERMVPHVTAWANRSS
jgi:UDP-N-acetylmuramoyl-tripeptide--D-alanyl-D-alanine ligase